MSYIGNSPGVASQRVETAFTATSNQTAFTPSSGYTLGYCDVYQNGVKLVNGDDYTASDGVTVTLATGAASGDSIVIVASFPRGLSDGYLKSEADAKYALIASPAFTGVATFAKGTSNGITIGDVSTNSNSVLRLHGTSAGRNWQIANNLNVAGIEFTPSTANGGTTYTTPTVTFLSSGNVGIGTTSPLQRLDVASSDTGVYQTIRSTSSGATNVALRIQDGTTGTTNSDGIYLGRTGAINYLWTYENEPWVFATNNTERMRINAGAPILCLAGGNTSATGTGIAFPATQSASSDANTLDDYEEGTWTPVLKGTSTNPVYTASQAQGSYVKVGKLVYVSFIIVVTGVSSQGTGNIYMDALPFSANDQSYAPTLTVMYNDTWDVDFRAMYASGISFTMRPIGVTQSNATWGGASTLSTGYFSGSGCYLTT